MEGQPINLSNIRDFVVKNINLNSKAWGINSDTTHSQEPSETDTQLEGQPINLSNIRDFVVKNINLNSKAWGINSDTTHSQEPSEQTLNLSTQVLAR